MTKLYSNDLFSRQAVQVHISQLNPDKKWVYDIKRKVEGRTTSQNSLYWRWIGIAGAELGYDKDDMHAEFMRKFLTPKIIEDLDGKERESYSTKRLSTGEMSTYLDAVSRFCAQDLGIFLPHPDDAHER